MKSWMTVFILLLSVPLAPIASGNGPAPKKIVLIAGKKSHGPEGNRVHDYPWSVRLLKVMLDNSNIAERVRVEMHFQGWPDDDKSLDDAAAILVVSDGRDGNLYEEAPHLASAERVARVEALHAKGCGLVMIHFSTFGPDRFAEQMLRWYGGYFDWEEAGERKWYSAIQWADSQIELGPLDHPVLRGVKPFQLKDEFYFNIRFNPNDKRTLPIWSVPALPGREPDGKRVAWARESENGARGFATTCGHDYNNWQHPEFRRTILNAIAWSAHVDLPAGGVESKYFEREAITAALANVKGTERAVVKPTAKVAPADEPIRVLLIAGNDKHKWHNWERTTPAIKASLERDPRIRVDVAYDIEELARRDLREYQALVQNYVNWQDPRGISPQARGAFLGFVRGGGGVIFVHFANGAFHSSLPGAESFDWPEYREMVLRIWHHGQNSRHDNFGRFAVDIADADHPLTKGLARFELDDELYHSQFGDAPLKPLITAISQQTKQPAPLAWTHELGQGRIFQTLLGHSEKTYQAFAAREMLRRAAAWVSKREVKPLAPAEDPDAAKATTPAATPATAAGKPAAPAEMLVAGKFGKALNAAGGFAASVPARPEWSQPPLTVELWVKLRDTKSYSIPIAHQSKTSGAHWELFTLPQTGWLAAYHPGLAPDHTYSAKPITDDAWHYLAFTWEADRTRLFVDGKQVAEQTVRNRGNKRNDDPLAIGALVERGLLCNGLVDEIRISRGIRKIEKTPDAPFASDDATLGLWRFDAAADGIVVDESAAKHGAKLVPLDAPAAKPAEKASDNPMSTTGVPAPAKSKTGDSHYGANTLGFSWSDEASRDDRWNRAIIGRFLASSLPLGKEAGTVNKGLSIQVGDKGEAAVCYDTEHGTLRAAWTGDFLKFTPARFGLIAPPEPAAPLRFTASAGPAWIGAKAQYAGLHVHGDRVVLAWRLTTEPTMKVNEVVPAKEVHLLETPWWETRDGASYWTRAIEYGNTPVPLKLRLGNFDPKQKNFELKREGKIQLIIVRAGDRALAWGLRDQPNPLDPNAAAAPRLEIAGEAGYVVLQGVGRLKLCAWEGPSAELPQFLAALEKTSATEAFGELITAGPRRWKEEIVTAGKWGQNDGPFAVDTFTLPFENPYRALFFPGGHDFFPNGDVALATVHGDVWRAAPSDEKLSKIKWTRFATGLFQPLGAKAVDGKIIIVGRDQLTRLHDENHDGEADFYENLCNLMPTSPSGHDYTTCLETDLAGNFYTVTAKEGVLKISPDGKKVETIAAGFRNPNGLGMGPGDVITVTPQEGNWTPTSNIVQIKPGGYYGFGGPKITPTNPLGYDLPLCYFPRRTDNSSGGQCWVPEKTWGPLAGQMLHFSFGQCKMLLCLREQVVPIDRSPLWQGGTISFPMVFDSGSMRGRFSPLDRHLYVSGLKGWVTAAAQDGCLQRVRYTGKPIDLPVAYRSYANGIAITFGRELDRDSAEEVGNYRLEAWNYRYRAEYGSADYRPSDPKQEGHDELEPQSATLLPDGKTVFLELPDLQPVNQVSIGYSLRAAGNGTVGENAQPIRDTFYLTLHAVSREAMDSEKLSRRVVAGRLTAAERESLQPGIQVDFRQGARQDRRVQRQAALHVAAAEAPATFLGPGKFHAQFAGLLQTPLRGDYRFYVTGSGHATIVVNDQQVVAGLIDAQRGPAAIPLPKGHVKLLVYYASLDQGSAEFRLDWAGEAFSREPIPPTALHHLPQRENVPAVVGRRAGLELWSTHHCGRCHAGPAAIAGLKGDRFLARHEIDSACFGSADAVAPPRLDELGKRLRSTWIAAWILDPRALRADAKMPALLPPSDPERRQKAADLAEFLSPAPEILAPPVANLEGLQKKGARLFESLGCIGCHYTTAQDPAEKSGRLSLHEVNEKFRAGAVAAWLREPSKHHPATTMPDFRLSNEEAESLEAHLAHTAKGSIKPWLEFAQASAERGKALFKSARCDSCHVLSSDAKLNSAALPFPVNAKRGCLGETAAARGAGPDLGLSAIERRELAAWSALPAIEAPRASPPEIAERLIARYRCTTCHPRDGQTPAFARYAADEGESGLAPEVLPSLTWTGEKLHTKWLTEFLRGDKRQALRPHLQARMPIYPQLADPLARGLAAEHGMTSDEPPPFSVDTALAKIGRQLSLKTGLDCRQCHGVGRDEPTGDDKTKIAPGINFSLVGPRLRAGYYHRFVLDPARVEIGTRMPQFSADRRTTKAAGYFGGDADRQFDALWHYLQGISGATDGKQFAEP